MYTKLHPYIGRESQYNVFRKSCQKPIYQFSSKDVWNSDKNTWKTKLPAYVYSYKTSKHELLTINRPADCGIVHHPHSPNTGGIPYALSLKNHWGIFKFGDLFFGISDPHWLSDYQGIHIQYRAELITAKYPTILKEHPSWNFEVGARLRHHALVSPNEPDNYEELTKPLTHDEMDYYDSVFMLIG